MNKNPFEAFSKLTRQERFERLVAMGALSQEDVLFLESSVHQDFHDLAENFVENSLGCFPLPLGVAAHFRIDNKDYAIPMAVEETSVIAAVSNTAKWIRQDGEIQTHIIGKDIIGQIQIACPKNIKSSIKLILDNKADLINLANINIVPNLVARGGGVSDIQCREVEDMLIIHVLLNPCDAMGANLINQVCEYLKKPIEDLTHEKINICILSNLVDTKLTQVKIIIRHVDAELGMGIESASKFAEADPYRAATHNKGVLNGMDPVAIATGNDWRALEAGVHAYAARTGKYAAVTQWRYNSENKILTGIFEAPVIVGIVGGVTRLHSTAKLCLRMLGVESSDELSRVIAAVGLVQNLGALKALSTHGIVEGHMKLHIRNLLLAAGAKEKEQKYLISDCEIFVKKNRKITESDVKNILNQFRYNGESSMIASDFHVKAHAKWILTGEHAVLRGHSALVFPIPNKYIELFYWDKPEPLEVDFNTPQGETLLVLFWGVFEEGLKLLNKKHTDIQGRLFFRNNIPMGAGMGFSAAFCVSLTKLFQYKGWLTAEDSFEFARKLEDHFHGKSSGVDIAGSLYDGGMKFTMQEGATPISLNWRPQLYLSHSGKVSVTSKCINLVKEIWESNKTLAEQIDLNMADSSRIAEKALNNSEAEGLPLLRSAILKANQSFEQWGLLEGEVNSHIQQLTDAGALACKPTGAGDGGYVLSLWDKMPELPFEMIAVF
ncbi:MAG TPA: hydroxymethylglutaryl-CoA reductase, degradative [Gammaproteobacteria bacterium]|nr:hydroxymethylglutaryl-CoA reductase, degradative [Gammaproteobacteria bacterium]